MHTNGPQIRHLTPIYARLRWCEDSKEPVTGRFQAAEFRRQTDFYSRSRKIGEIPPEMIFMNF